ncbi:hypothetical protein [Streptomyces sp. NPDC007172]|uniref:hypothetical protein n=1 Tax=Streptomyces sp. NPDC007172 TaxID=3364776 RepID=UPI003698B95C
MGDHVKRLPPGAQPESGQAAWSGTSAERWAKARVPVMFAPAGGSWILIIAVATSYSLTSAWSGAAGGGTDWRGYPANVLLAALPFWYRFLPAVTVPAALVVALDAAVSSTSLDPFDGHTGSGHVLELAVCAWALTGASLRLRARRRQSALASLAAAGHRRLPLPDGTPESDGYRGFRQVYLGLVLCLVALGILTDGVARNLSSPSGGPSYDALGQQAVGLVLLVAGTTSYGWGHVAYRAARRLHDERQPAFKVAVRIGPHGYHWLYPDALTPSGRPLIAYRPKGRDTHRGRFLGTSSAYGPEVGHYDIDPHAEPFEAILYGVPREGAEIAVEHAVMERRPHESYEQTHTVVTVARLLPLRRHGLRPWQPADGAVRHATRRARVQEEERVRRERDERQEARRRRRVSGTPTSRPGTQPPSSGRRNRWGDGGAGCGGGDGGSGHGCGGCGGG